MSSSKSDKVATSTVAEATPGGAPNLCHTCTEPITTTQFIRVGNYKFHKEHFVCCECKTSLHEKKFHHKESKFYCANDYVNKFCHTCGGCKQKITGGSIVQAFGGYYHPEHFGCKICQKPFKNGKYYEADSEPYCEEHYFALTAEKCSVCSLGVKDSEIIRVQGKAYHQHCLSCCHCGLPLAQKGSIFQKDGNVYCRNDYLNFFCKRCTACADHIMKHCLEGGQMVNSSQGTSQPIEEITADIPILGHNGCGLAECGHDGAELQPNERECMELTFQDGRTLVCTPDHQLLTSNGYLPAGELKPNCSSVLASVRWPSSLPTPNEASFNLTLLSSAIQLHMRDQHSRSQTLAFVRILGFMTTQQQSCSSSLDSSAFSQVHLTQPFDRQLFQRDLELLTGTSLPSSLIQSAILTLPSTVAADLYSQSLSTTSLPAFLIAPSCPLSIKHAFLSGVYGAAGQAPKLEVEKFTEMQLPSAVSKLQSDLRLDSFDLATFEKHIGFAYATLKQQQLSIAAAWYSSHQQSPSSTSFTSLNATDFLHACKAESFYHGSPSSSKAENLTLPTFELTLTSTRSVGFRWVYDLINSEHHSFQANGLIVHNCISVNDEFYHPDCLQCSHCKKKLDKYICVQGYLLCQEHTEIKLDPLDCSICNKVIVGDVILSVGRKMHPECFKCGFCSKAMQKATAKLKDDKLCCPECMLKKDPTLMAKNAALAAAAAKEGNHGMEGEVQIGSSSTATPTSSRGAVAIAAPKPIDHDQFTKYEKPSRPRKASKALPQGKIEWKKGELIGKGSFGKVYMAMNSATGELIAVKQVRLNTAEEQEQAAAIQNEIGLMENLRHPNIVSLLGTQRNGNKLNILMEYVPGKSLDSLLEKFGGFSEKVIRSYTKQLLEALAYCHANRVVHRDIKGKNILIDTKGNLKLADFGSAKRFTNVMSKDAPSLSYNYTPLWTAPEVLVGDYNSKVDIWSLGCVIIEMASAKPPWSEQNFENPFRALYHIGNSDSIPKIPETLSEVGLNFVKQCLKRNPDERPDAAFLLKQEWLSGIESLPNNSDDSGSEGEEQVSGSESD